MNQKTVNALQEVGNLMARQLGYETPVEMTICLPKTVCTICCKIYPAESECEPCPHCGASYFSQVNDDELKAVGQEYQTDKRYVFEQEETD